MELQHSAIISMTHRGKAVPAHAISTCRGSGDTAPLILNLGTRQMFSGQPHTQATLLPEREKKKKKKPPLVPTEQETWSTPKPIWTFLSTVKPLGPARNQTLDHPVNMTDWIQGSVLFILAECDCICNETVEINAFMLSMPKS